MELLVQRICKGVEEAEKRIKPNEATLNQVPVQGTDVFLSYSRGDSALVEELYKTLTERGLNVWYDRQSLHKGQDFMRQIENAVKNSTFFVPVLSNTIIRQAGKEHPYRLEWKYAVEHIQLIGGIPYCFPFFEKGFDMDDLVADIPADLKRHDAYDFTTLNYKKKAEELANCLLKERERRKSNG